MGREDEQRTCLQDAIRELFSEWFGICYENAAPNMTWSHLLEACKTSDHNEGNLDLNPEEKQEEKTENTKINSIIEQELITAIKTTLNINNYSLIVQLKGNYDFCDSFDQTKEFYTIQSGISGLIDPIINKIEHRNILTPDIFQRLEKKFSETIMNGNKEYQNKFDRFKFCQIKKKINNNNNNNNNNNEQVSFTLVYFSVSIKAQVTQNFLWANYSKTYVNMQYMDKKFEDREALLTFVHQCVTEIKEQKYAALEKFKKKQCH